MIIETAKDFNDLERICRAKWNMSWSEYRALIKTYKRVAWEHHQNKNGASALTDTPPNTNNQVSKQGQNNYDKQHA
jgi:hypothetical protein